MPKRCSRTRPTRPTRAGLPVAALIAALTLPACEPGTPTADAVPPPTSKSAPDELRLVTLPPNLPVLVEPQGPASSRPAAEFYLEALELLGDPPPPPADADAPEGVTDTEAPPPTVTPPADPALAARAADRLIAAVGAPTTRESLVDASQPLSLRGERELSLRLNGLVDAALAEARRVAEHDPNRATAIISAVIELGRHLIEHNTRLATRLAGVSAVEAALERFVEQGGSTGARHDKFLRWGLAMVPFGQWRAKYDTLSAAVPHTGDLINIGLHDEDPTFRVTAALWMGVTYGYLTPGPERAAIADALEQLTADPDETVRKAAEAARNAAAEAP